MESCPDYPVINSAIDGRFEYPFNAIFNAGGTGTEIVNVGVSASCSGSREWTIMVLLAFYAPQYVSSYPELLFTVLDTSCWNGTDYVDCLEMGVIGDYFLPLVSYIGVSRVTNGCAVTRLNDCSWYVGEFVTDVPACCEGITMATCDDLVGEIAALNLSVQCLTQKLELLVRMYRDCGLDSQSQAIIANYNQKLLVDGANQISQSIIAGMTALAGTTVDAPTYPNAVIFNPADIADITPLEPVVELGGSCGAITFPPTFP